MKGLQVRGGAVLLWRLGQLTYGDQTRWSRAPMPKGMWAFPYPYYDSSFTEHQYSYYMPKRLQVNDAGAPLDPTWWRDGEGAIPTVLELDEWGWPLDYHIHVSPDFDRARKAWIRDVGARTLPLRRFWYTGDVFTHLPRSNFDPQDWESFDTWHRVDAVEAARRLRKATGQLSSRPDHRVNRRGDVGMMELFLAPNIGRIR